MVAPMPPRTTATQPEPPSEMSSYRARRALSAVTIGQVHSAQVSASVVTDPPLWTRSLAIAPRCAPAARRGARGGTQLSNSERRGMKDLITVLAWAVPISLLVYLCWTTTNILRGLHRISETLDGETTIEATDQDSV